LILLNKIGTEYVRNLWISDFLTAPEREVIGHDDKVTNTGRRIWAETDSDSENEEPII
jgi:hypothetical protein